MDDPQPQNATPAPRHQPSAGFNYGVSTSTSLRHNFWVSRLLDCRFHASQVASFISIFGNSTVQLWADPPLLKAFQSSSIFLLVKPWIQWTHSKDVSMKLNEITLMWGLRQASELALPEKTGRQLSRAYVTQIVEVPPSWLLAPSDFFLSSQESAPWQVSAWTQKVSVTGQAGQATQALPYCGVYIQKSMAGENPKSADGGDSIGVPSIFLVALQRTQWDPGRGNQATGSSSIIPSATAST